MRQKAEAFATIKHDGQFRKNNVTPYIIHPIGVAKIVEQFGGDEVQVAIALLHDVIEDCFEGGLKLTGFKQIRNEFGDEVALGVLDLTNTSKQDAPELNRAQRKAKDTAELVNIPVRTKLVKLADILYNINDLEGFTNGFATKFLKEKQAQAFAVKEGSPALYAQILLDIDRQLARFGAAD